AETPLFRSKRAETLAMLLKARLVLQNDASIVSPEAFRRRLEKPLARQAIQSLVRRIKGERVGVSLADIAICGAVAPYGALTGGKLVAMLLAGPEVIAAYQRKYSTAESII